MEKAIASILKNYASSKKDIFLVRAKTLLPIPAKMAEKTEPGI